MTYLEEKMRKENTVGRRANTIVDSVKIGHVRLVWQIKVLAIPARLEVYLSTKTLRTIEAGRKTIGLRCWLCVIDTGEVDLELLEKP